MALIVQTNPPSDTANSYGDLVGFKAYHDDRMQDYSAYADPEITASLIEGTSYLDMRWTYNGWRINSTQPTEFPRNGLFNDRGDLVVGIPANVVKATYEYALRWLRQGRTLLPDVDSDPTGRAIKSSEEQVGPVTTKVEYATSSGVAMPVYPYPDGLLRSRGYIGGTANIGGVTSGNLGRS